MSDQQLENFDVNSIPNDAETSCILEANLEYPAAIHDIHSDLPVPQESRAVQVRTFLLTASSYMKLHIKRAAHSKIIPSLNDKEKYVVHYSSTTTTQEPQVVICFWSSHAENPPRIRVYIIVLASNLHLYEHWEKESRPQRVWTGLLQIDEKLDIWQDTGDCQMLQRNRASPHQKANEEDYS